MILNNGESYELDRVVIRHGSTVKVIPMDMIKSITDDTGRTERIHEVVPTASGREDAHRRTSAGKVQEGRRVQEQETGGGQGKISAAEGKATK